MALVEDCKHAVEVSVPVEAVGAETEKVAGDFQKRARLPGFRPGKAPLSMIRKSFESDIRSKVVENLIPRYLDKLIEDEHLRVVSRPDIIDVHYTPGEPLTFKAEFEVAPEFELGQYRDLEVSYTPPVVSPEEVNAQIELTREKKATFANVDPRPLEDGDTAVVSLESLSGASEPIKSEEVMLDIGGADTMPAFTEGLRGMAPGDEKDIEVTYAEGQGPAHLSGQTVLFHVIVNGIRKKELPEINDEFAQDLGDFRTLDELREAVRKGMLAQRENEAQRLARNTLVDKLADNHDFPVPEVYIDNQIRSRLTQQLEQLDREGLDVSQYQPDWQKLRERDGENARREVKGMLLVGKIAEREGLHASNAEVDKQVELIARQQRMPIPVMRKRLEENGGMSRIASHIVTEKTLNFLFEHARKTAE